MNERMVFLKQRIYWLAAVCLLLVLAGCGSLPAEKAAAPDSGEALLWGNVPITFENITMPYVEPGILFAEDREGEAVPILDEEELWLLMDDYGIRNGSAAAEALLSINSVYAAKITMSRRTEPLVFFFEGAGSNPDPAVRKDALCVVVWDGRIIYLDQGSTTIPDWPFLPFKNEGRDMPTLKSGIYDFDTVNHKGSYAALRVLDDQVVRFHTASNFYEDVSYKQSIQVHRRTQETVSPRNESWGSSVGCLLVGDSSTAAGGSYAQFIQAVGATPYGSGGNARYRNNVSGTIVVDRSLGADYLRAVGYPDEAIELLES